MAKETFNPKKSPRAPIKKLPDDLMMGKKRPYDHELEQVVLGALMLEKNALSEVIEILKPSTFDDEKNQRVFGAIHSLFTRSEAIDIMTVAAQLRSTGELEIAGGAFYISQLTNRVNSTANIVYHARILLQYAIKRELIGIANDTMGSAYDETSDVFDVLDKMEQSLFEVSEMNIRKNYEGVRNVMTSAIKELEAMRNQKDGLTGVPSGFPELDRTTAGWQRSDLVIIAARPAMGKTAFVLSILRNAAVDFKKGVVIFSLEMSSVQLMKRLLSAEAEIPSEKLKTGKLAGFEWEQLVTKTARLGESPIFIDDTPALSILELRAKCRRLKAQHDVQLIIIDYLQLMTADTGGKSGGNREQEIALISRSLKQLAKELDVPVLALSQLSRAVETRGGDKRPQLSDLRESGSIEQDADMVMFLYRPEYYDITETEDGMPTKGLAEIIIAKHRNGQTGTVNLKYIGSFTKFASWEETGQLEPLSMGDPTFQSDYVSDMPGQSNTITLGSRMNNDFDLGMGNLPERPFNPDKAPF